MKVTKDEKYFLICFVSSRYKNQKWNIAYDHAEEYFVKVNGNNK